MDLHDYQVDLHKRISEAQHKYVYFILAASGSAIGFSINFIISKSITEHLWLLFIAIIAWVFSFLLGCLFLLGWQSMMNTSLFQTTLEGSQYIDKLEKEYQEKYKKAEQYFRWMFYFLIGGTVYFIIWFLICQYPNVKL